MKRRIVFIDFDGTITTRDSLLAYFFFRHGKLKTILRLISIAPFYAMWVLKILSVQKAKEKVLSRFLKNEPLDSFNMHCEEFVRTRIPKLIRPKALIEIQKLKDNNAEVIIVSASPENWLGIWCKQVGASL